MGFVGFLNFGLKCIQLLAWPSLALGYPLCASIRAIETNSKYHMRKLVTYWILFSLISLFELAFVKLIEWIPFWPFLKIIAISCLVLHRFTGAYYAYKWFVRLFLSVNLWQRVQDINWLNKKKELFLMRETFLAAAERYLDENGTEALEKLIASKSNSKALNITRNDINAVEHKENVAATDKIHSNNKAPNVAQNDINAVEHEENVVATDTIQSNCKALNVAQNDINVVEHEENVAATNNIQSNNKLPNVAQNDINAVELEENVAATDKITNNKVPNVSQNDINVVEHEKNVAASDNIQSNSKVPTAQNDINAVELEENVATTDKIQTNNKVPYAAQNDINAVEHEKNVAATNKIVKHVDTNLSRTQQKLGTSTEVKEFTSAATVRVLPVPPTLRIQKDWTCDVCQLKTTCEVTFNSHLQGRKHKSKCEKLKSSMQAMKVEGSSTASNQEPKKAISGNRLGQNKTQKTEEKAVELEENLAATDKIQSINKVPNVAQNDINAVELEENVAAIDKISNNKVPNVAQNDINAVEPEENVAATDKIQSNIKAPNVPQNDINTVEHEENVAATDKIQSNIKAPNVAQNDINTVEHEENVAATDKIVKHVDKNLSRTQQKLGTSAEVKEVTSAATLRDYVLPVPPTLRIQKKWTCAVCQVKTTCEVSLNSHLQGRKHKSKCEKLKSNMQAMKVECSSSTASNQEPKKAVSGNRLCQNKTQKAEEKLKFDVNTEQWKPRKPANAAAGGGGGIRESKYWFDMHNVSCSGEIDMAAHLNGRRHFSLLNEFDDILQVPNYGAMVPQCLNGLPNYGAVAAQGFTGVPNYGAMVPQAFNEVPNSGAMVPRDFNGVPNSGAMVPQAFNGVLNSGAMVPQGFNGVSNYGAMVPQAFKGLEQI